MASVWPLALAVTRLFSVCANPITHGAPSMLPAELQCYAVRSGAYGL